MRIASHLSNSAAEWGTPERVAFAERDRPLDRKCPERLNGPVDLRGGQGTQPDDAGAPVLIDEARRRVRLTGEQLDVLGAIALGEELTAAQREPLTVLRAAGVVGEGMRVHPLAAALARAYGLPVIRFVVEVTGPQGLTLAHGVVHGEDVWLSDPWPAARPGDPVTYQRSELPTWLWDVARSVGLRRSRPPADAAPVSLPVGALDDVLEVLAAVPPEDWERARVAGIAATDAELLPVPGLPTVPLEPAARTRLIAVLASLESSWRVTVGWGEARTEGEAQAARSLAVLDCGPEGYWRRTSPAEPVTTVRPEDEVRLEPVSAGEIWTALADLLPSSAELREEQALQAAAEGARG